MAANQSGSITIVEVDENQKAAKPDITFVFPKDSGRAIHTQKAILAAESEIFKVQFESPLNDEDACDRIIIEDISFDTFKTMINFIYGDDKTKKRLIPPSDCYALMYASHKYFLHDLTNSVITLLRKTNYVDQNGRFTYSVVHFYRSVEMFNIKILNDHVLNISIRFPEAIINQLKKTEVDLRLLQKILESPKMNCTEFELHNAIWNMFMREYKGKKYTDEAFRNDVGKLKLLIRFPVMTGDEILVCGNKKPSLLTLQEIVDFQLWSQKKIITTTIHAYSVDTRMKYYYRSPAHNDDGYWRDIKE